MRKQLFFALLIASSLVVTSCGGKKSSSQSGSSADSNSSSSIVIPDAPALSGEKIADFSKGETEEIFGSDGWSNGQPFNAVWKKENITYSNGQMHLAIKAEEAVDGDNTYPYTAGEARSHHLYNYGDFEVRMKPTNIVGTVSTFFTYTGEYDEIDGVKNEHHEIDIEFLGKDTTKVQFNYFVKGVGEHEYIHDLGFDASKEFHNYGFRWSSEAVTWFVDGKAVYQVKASDKNPLPSQAGRIMTSYWPSSADGWSGHFDGNTSKTVDYEWIKCSGEASYADADKPVDPIDPDQGVKWDEITPVDLTFAGGSNYTIVNSGSTSTISYEESGGWAAVSCGTINSTINANNVVNVTLKNESATKSNVRVDIQGTTKSGNSDCLNTGAAAKNHSEVTTDMQWGGSKIEIAAGEEVELVINYDVTTEAKGAATNLLVFPDSLQESSVAHAGGKIVVSKVRFANTTGAPIVPYTPTPVDPGDDPTPSIWDNITETDVTFVAQRADYYTVAKDNGVTTVTYSEAGEWGTIAAGDETLLGVINSHNKINLTLKNNSTTASNLRVDIQGTKKVGNSDCLNTAAEARGHNEVRTDTTWGGSFVTLAAGEQVEFIVTYDVTTETKYGAISLLVFLDSMQGSAVAHEGGNISISKIKFANTTDGEIVPHVVPTDPVDPQPETGEGLALAFGGNEEYVLSTSEATKSLTVSYTGIGGSSYKNINADLQASDVENKTTFSITIKNNAQTSSQIRIDVLGQTQVGNTNCLNTSAVAEGHSEIYTDTTWGGSKLDVAAAETVTVVVTFDQTTEKGTAQKIMLFIDSAHNDANEYDGNVTFSNFVFGPEEQQQEDEGAELTFSNETAYTLDPVNTATKTVNVTYTDFAGNSYANFGAGLWHELVDGASYFSLKIKNNGTNDVRFRVDIKDASGNCLNTSAHAAEHTDDVYTDTTWGGSYITVAANEEVVFVIDFNQSQAEATFVMFFVDTARGDENTYSGNLDLSNFVFGGNEVEYSSVTFNASDVYTLDPAGEATESVNVSYTNVAGNSYSNFSAGADDLATAESFTLKIKNNGEASVRFRVDIKNGETCLNTVEGTSTNGGTDLYTDTQYGGTYVTVTAGAEITLTVAFDNSELAPQYIMFFVDSATWNDETTHSGSLTLSNFLFN